VRDARNERFDFLGYTFGPHRRAQVGGSESGQHACRSSPNDDKVSHFFSRCLADADALTSDEPLKYRNGLPVALDYHSRIRLEESVLSERAHLGANCASTPNRIITLPSAPFCLKSLTLVI
jgi:hypothetical protein